MVGTHDVNLKAGNNIDIDAAEESYYRKQETKTKKSGLMSSGGIGVTIGHEKENLKQTDSEQAYLGSTVGSTEGNVSIQAGKDITVKGSDIIAKQDVNLTGENVAIEALDAKTTYNEQYTYEKSGLTIALTGTAADMYEAAKAVERAKEKGNDKLLALQSIKSALTALEAIEDLQLQNQQGQKQASIGVSVMVGTQRTEREVNQEQHNVISSGVSAGQNIHITATGDANEQGGDITLKGSEVKAGNDINLTANRDVNVIGAVNTQHSDRDEKSYGGGVGIQLQFGGDESGLRFKANGNFSRERENADGSAWTESVIDAKNQLNIKTGHDVNVVGGQLKGDTVKMNVGNNLNIQSLQDTDNYDYEKISASVSGTAGYGGVSANGSLSATEMESKWASVTDQSGIFAGKGGYDITVGNNTDLKGAVIASKAEDTSKNKLDTGTISFSDIKNKADFKVTHVAISGGTAGPGAPTAFKDSDSDSSTTKSAVEKGELIIRNQDQQKQDINGLSRDTDSANNPLKQIFDKQKELDKIETVELIKDIAQQAKSVVKKYDRIEAQKEVDKNKDALTRAEAEKRYKYLSDEEKAKYASFEQYYEDNKDYIYYALVDKQLETNKNKDKNLGTMGGNVSKGIDTAMAIVTGVITGDITGSLAGASAPWIAEQIKLHTGHQDEKGNWVTDDIAGNLIAHAILGAVVAELQGGPSIAGGAGAVVGELAAKLIREQLYGKDVKDLTEAEKQNISALAQLAAGLAIAAGGGDTGAAGAAIAAGKNAVENNAVSTSDGGNWGAWLNIHHDTGAQYDATLDAYANNYLTAEETEQALSGLIKGKGMPNGSDYAELWMRAPEQIGQYLPGPIGIAMEILALADVAITNTDKANLVQLLTEASKDHLSGLDNSESMAALDMMISRLAAGSKNKQLQGIIKRNVESNVAKNQKGNASSKFGDHVAKEQQINAGKGKTNPTAPIKINIANDFTKSPQSIWGRSADDIAKDFQAAGYQVNVRQSTRGSGQAVIIEVKGHPEISQIQIHPGGGRHGGSYYKVSTTTQGTLKVVDPKTYKSSAGEKATIINKPKE
ncbi:hypothetical protein GYM74_07755 [Gilliamella sp. ESL0405]|nr:hypothetical protein GYM74_07755 [Gilliamella sp. ESL0405]